MESTVHKCSEESEAINGASVPLQVLLEADDSQTKSADIEEQSAPHGTCSSDVQMDGTMVVKCVVRTEETEEPASEYLPNGSKGGNCTRKTSLNEMNADQRRELMEIARECNETMIHRLRSIASERFNIEMTNEVVMDLLTAQNRWRSTAPSGEMTVDVDDGTKRTQGTNERRSEDIASNEAGSKLSESLSDPAEEWRLSLLQFGKATGAAQIRQGVAKMEANRECSGRDEVQLEGDSKEATNRILKRGKRKSGEACGSSSSDEKSSFKKRVALSNSVRGTAIKLVCDRNMSHASVGKLLGIPKGTVSSMVRCFKSTSRIEMAQRGGCPPKLDDNQQLAIAKYVRENEGTTLKRIVQFIKDAFNIDVTRSTIQRVLKSHKLVLRKTPIAFVKYLNNEFFEEPEGNAAQECSRLLVTANVSKEGEVKEETVEKRPTEVAAAGESRKKRHLMLSNYIRHKIVEFVVRWGMSHSKVGSLLGIPKGTVSGVVRCFQQNNRINKIKQGGSYSKLTVEHKAALVKYVADNRDVSIRQAVEYVKQTSGKQVSKQMIYSVLKPHNLHKRRKLPHWPEWYVSNKEHVVDLPFKLQPTGRGGRTPALPATSSSDVGERSTSTDGSTVPNLMDADQNDGLFRSMANNDTEKAPLGYVEDHDTLLLQHVHGLFGSASDGPQTTKIVKASDEDAVGVGSLSHVEVSSISEVASYLDFRTAGEDETTMAKKKKYSCLSNTDRQRIISCVVHKGLSHSVVAKLFDVPRGTVSSIIRCFQKTNRIEKIHKGGSRPKLTNEQQQSMVRFHEENGPQSIKQLQSYCRNTFGIEVSKSTISLTLKRHMSPLKRKSK